MKKVSIDLMLGRRSMSHFRVITPKLLILVAKMPVNAAIKSSNYALKFGKTGLNAGEICEKFNKESASSWSKGVLIQVVFLINATKNVIMELLGPTIYVLLNIIFYMDLKEIPKPNMPVLKRTLLKIFFKVAQVKCMSTDKEKLIRTLLQIIGTWLSFDPYNPWRQLKSKFNFRKKGKK